MTDRWLFLSAVEALQEKQKALGRESWKADDLADKSRLAGNEKDMVYDGGLDD